VLGVHRPLDPVTLTGLPLTGDDEPGTGPAATVGYGRSTMPQPTASAMDTHFSTPTSSFDGVRTWNLLCVGVGSPGM
jgi:hypothetical protein